MGELGRSDYRPDVDGLRAVAILGVVAFHSGLPHAGGGYTGVDVFFVISGFLITGLLLREQAASGRIDLINFYARRVRRLIPALSVVLLATVALGFIVLKPSGEQQGLGLAAISTAAFVANVYAWRAGNSYFWPESERMPLLHTWTLSVEEQFYLVFPVLLVLAAWIARRLGRPVLKPMLVAGLVGSLLLWLLLNRWRDSAAFYLSPPRAWEFAAGAMLAVSPLKLRPAHAASLAGAGLAMIVAAFFALPAQAAFGGLFAAPPVLGALAVIAGCAAAPTGLPARLLASRPMVAIGKLSYSWYLWHWPLLAFARAVSLHRDLPRDLAISAAALALAALTYWLIEQPVRVRRPGPFASRIGAVVAGAALLALCAAAGAALWAHGQARLRANPQAQIIAAAKTSHWPLPADCLDYRLPFAKLKPAARCSVGAANPRATLVLYGDSHAQAQIVGIDRAAKAAGARVIVRTRPGCKIYDAQPPRGGPLAAALRRECYAFNRDLAGEAPALLRDEKVSAVLVSARWGSDEAWGPRLGRVIDAWHAQGLAVAVIEDTGAFPHDILACLAHRPADQCGQTPAAAQANRRKGLQPLLALARTRPWLTLYDPQPALCDATLCPAADAVGRPLYRDDNHLSEAGAARLAPSLQSLLESLRDQPLRQ